MAEDDLELTCFQLVAQAGAARSSFVEAIDKAERGDFEAAALSIDDGDVHFNAAHEIHMRLLQKEADGEQLAFRIILLHSEDLMAGAEILRIMAQKFIKLYRHVGKE